MQAAPGAFELLEVGVVHDRGELLGQRLVDGLDAGVDRLGDVLVQVTVPLSASSVKRLEQVLGPASARSAWWRRWTWSSRLLALRRRWSASAALGLLFCSLAMLYFCPSSGACDAEFAGELLHLVGVLQDLFQQVLQVVGAVDLGQQVAELVAGLQQLAQRLDLLDDFAGSKSSIELNLSCTAISLPSPLSVFSTLQVQARASSGHHVVEVVAVDLDELAVLQRLERLGRVAGEVAQDADDERQLLHDDRPFGLDLVGDVDPRLADPLSLS